MWYSSFCSEGPKNHLNLKILVPDFVPRGLEARRRWGFEARQEGFRGTAGGVSRHGEVGFRRRRPSKTQMGPRGKAGNDKALRCSVSVAAPRNPTSPCLETPPTVPRNPSYHASKPLLLCLETPPLPRLETPGDKIWERHKFLWWRIPLTHTCIQHPSDPRQLTSSIGLLILKHLSSQEYELRFIS